MEDSRIDSIVNRCVKNLVEDYENYEEDFLTEGDVASSLFCMLKDAMREHHVEGFKIHRELRPYTQQKGKRHVVKLDKDGATWIPQKTRNSGAVVDIAIVSDEQRYFAKARQIACGQKYWRLLTYPLEAFAVCIEVKVRVSGNIKRIKKDVDKLRMIRNTLKECGKKCLVQLVVADRKASPRSMKTIEEHCKTSSIDFKHTCIGDR